MALFGNSSNDLPVTQVKALSDRGYSENDIKDILRKKGYSEDEINLTLQKALVAKVSSKVPGLIPLDSTSNPAPSLPAQSVSKPPMPEPHQEKHEELVPSIGDTHSLFGSIGAKQEDLAFDKHDLPAPPMTPHDDAQRQEGYEIDLEPIVEAIVEEKWTDTAQILVDLQERLENLERVSKPGKTDDVVQLEYLVKQTQDRLERLEQSLDEVSIKVNSIEKAFKQFIPSLTGNIKALSDAVRNIRLGDSQSQTQ